MDFEKKYKRQISLQEIGIEGQKKLKQAKVLLVGAGGLGSAVSIYLTAAGIGTLGVIDSDVVSLSNLQRQILYYESEIGKSKVKCAKKKLQKLNSDTKINIYQENLTADNAKDIISNYDIVVDGTDNFQTRFLINDTCVLCDKVYIYGAIAGFSGQVSVFNYKGGANYRTLFSEEDVLEMKPEKSVIGTLAGIIGCIEATEAIKVIVNMGNILSNQLFTINLLTLETHIFEL
ncbi:MAG: HesA/MoeB/ThiF family protein [Ignavibacteria bacterium]|jgi:molybdopterin/thiamine biosynthesis adenylyltransferase|nr:HesA/MoeB/ThiF family protein [Ignavibacteria bacterium]